MHSYQPHKITRSRVIVSLMVMTMLASCAAPAVDSGSKSPGATSAKQPAPVSPTTMAQTKANAAAGSAKAGQEEIRFTDVASCKVETERLNAEYKILKDAFDAGTLTGTAPIQPTLQPDECEAFIASAEQEYAAQAPTYAQQSDCEASGRSCERVEPSPSNNYVEPIYRPVFFGSYGYNPWVPPIYIGGRRDYGQQTVIIERDSSRANSGSRTSGGSGTSSSTSSNQSRPATSKTTSKTTRPGSSSTTPSKPSSTSGSGAVTGRGSSGFGSSYGYSGKGGK